MISLSPVLARHLETLQQRFPEANADMLPDQSTLVRVPHVALPPGWSRTETAVWFIAPPMYPVAPPDCFWADLGLRLADGGIPMNVNESNPVPHVSEPRLWFSWHVQNWSPISSTLSTFMRVVEDRFRRAN